MGTIRRSPEDWVRFQNPCDIEYSEDVITQTYDEMVLPTLAKMKYESLGFKLKEQLMTQKEFDEIRKDCLSLYQRAGSLQDANFLSHLMNYDPPEGLRLATAEMMIQGYDNGGDILRMANNMIKFRQAQVRVRSPGEYMNKNRTLRVYTMSLDEFIAEPALSAKRFFDFVLDGTDVTREHKEAVAMQYERYYREKTKYSGHITQNRSDSREQLMEYLRHDKVFGPPLGKIQKLVETALEDNLNGF